MEVERCIDLQLNGCGDGLKKARNGEACDDGNLISGDGCSSSCLVEFLWTCTSTENALSVCTAITCGNGVSNAGEECDDFNFVDNDGCTKCVEDIGYKCTGTTCKKMCGDGKVYTQKKIDPATGLLKTVYQEQCDTQPGCDTKCKALPGWTCTVNEALESATCVQTCGNNQHDPGEVCDDGNNVSGDGCAQGCLAIEPPYQCPLVGACNKYCGNDLFEGNDTSIGKLDGISTE